MNDSSLASYEHPFVTVDIIVFSIRKEALQIALVKRGIDPYKGMWAIPGGFVGIAESLEEAARREVREEIGVSDVYLEQLYSFGDVGRDPRSRVITVAYVALMPEHQDKITPETISDAAEAAWFPVNELPELAFDHAKIIKLALQRLRSKLEYSTLAYALLPETFRLTDLQKIYEIILGQPIDKRNFRKRILSLGVLQSTEETYAGAHRPARLYRFKERQLTLL